MSQTAASVSGAPQPAKPEVIQTEYSGKSRFRWGWLLLILLLGGGVAGWYYYSKHSSGGTLQYRTTPVGRGDILQEVTANGSLVPLKQVEVGSQVSGIIEKILVDFNSQVKQNDLLARIDPSTYQKNMAQAKAQLAQAKAAMELAAVNYKRAGELFKNNLISAAEHDTTVAAYHQAEATVQIQEAQVERANVDIGYTQIHAPIDGVIISRSVDEGQTVASSFNTPRLFVIANDLTKMRIEAAVSEADVGGVEEGQTVTFTVDAFLNRKFHGKVQQVRFAPITNQNVVTYTAIVQVDNPDLKLRPGMTAIARIVTEEKKNVVRLQNSALRFRPPAGAIVESATNSTAPGSTNQAAAVTLDSTGNPVPPWRAEGRRPNEGEREKWEASLTPEQREKYQAMVQQMRQRFAEGGGGGGAGGGAGGAGGPPGGAQRAKPEGPTTATVYLLQTGTEPDAKPVLKPVTVKAGATDGAFTEIIDGLKEGDLVVTGSTTAAAAAASAEPTRNPFSPFGGGPPRAPARR